MGIFGWDLPPGCSVHDLPGNGEDVDEAMWTVLHEKFPWLDQLLDGDMPTRKEDRRAIALSPNELYEKIILLVDYVAHEAAKPSAEAEPFDETPEFP